MKISKPKGLILFGIILSFSGAFLLIFTGRSGNFLYLRLNALCGLIPVVAGIILSIRNDQKNEKKIRWIKTVALIYSCFAILAIIISFLLGR